MNPCSCNDTTSMSTRHCLNCQVTWQEPKPFHERVSECKQHHDSIAICGGGYQLCEKCTNEGYYVSVSSGFGFGGATVMKH